MENPEGPAALFLYFIVYAFIGYLIEIVFCSIQEKKLVNRGFLFGPILPIYGLAMLLMILLTSSLKDNFAYLFFSSILICTALEYFASWLLEKLAGVKWWDYSEITKFNLNGRISVGSSLAFGIVSTLVTYYIHPPVQTFVLSLDSLANPLAVALTCLLLLDIFASAYAVGRIKDNKALRKISGDQTNEIKRLARLAIAQLITGKNYAEQKLEATKKSAQKKFRQTTRSLKKKQKEFKKKFNQLTS